MKPIEVFENLFEPLRLELGNDSWEFLMKRGQIFIDQCIPTIPAVNEPEKPTDEEIDPDSVNCPKCKGKDVRPYRDHLCCYECGEYFRPNGCATN
jgi:hypothetical protein